MQYNKKGIKTYDNNTASSLFTFIEISRRQKHSPSIAFIRLRTVRYKRQDKVGNGDSVTIRFVLCKDTQFRKNSVSLVWRHFVWKENNCGSKISYLIVYEKEVQRINNWSKLLCLSKLVKGSTRSCVNNKELIWN